MCELIFLHHHALQKNEVEFLLSQLIFSEACFSEKRVEILQRNPFTLEVVLLRTQLPASFEEEFNDW
jgi:hypothetical protein